MTSLRTSLSAFALLVAVATQSAQAPGLYIPGAGPISRSMGGASTAAPIDPASAQLWNPAAMSGMRQSEVMFGAEFLYADTHLSGTVPAGAFNGVFR